MGKNKEILNNKSNKLRINKYKNCMNNRHKGWILPSVMIISTIMLLMLCSTMKSFDNRNFYIKNYKEYILEENESNTHKEYLMSSFNKYVEDNIDQIKSQTIDTYFRNVKIESQINHEGRYISYNSDKKFFEMNVRVWIYPFIMTFEEDDIKYKFK